MKESERERGRERMIYLLATDFCNTSTNMRAARLPSGGKVEGAHAMVRLNVRL